MRKNLTVIGLIVVALLAGGCASVPMASDDKDAAAKSFAAKAGKANVYVYRSESLGAAIKIPVVLDGKLVGVHRKKRLRTGEPDGGSGASERPAWDGLLAVQAAASCDRGESGDRKPS